MRIKILALLGLSVALAGCPALQSDWTIGGSGAVDASVDAAGPEPAGGRSDSGDGGTSASLDGSAGSAAGGSGGALGSSGGSIGSGGSLAAGGTSSGSGGSPSGGVTGTGGVTGSSPPSCAGLASTCGPSSNESCCTSPLVTGGTFYRSYDGVTTSPIDYTSNAYPATVSDFLLDKYEITVGRFRKFVAAWNGGWRPAAGAGKHGHLNGGSGLTDSSGTVAYESGWSAAWVSNVAPTDANLQCPGSQYPYQTWTPSTGANENRPINCENWFEAYAFCIWDGGFLPSEAEWNYAASGGDEQRVYPWSSPANLTTIGCSYANYEYVPSSLCAPAGANDVGSEAPTGNGKYGQTDLGGNVREWTLDWRASSYGSVCNNCTQLSTSATGRAIRGGAFDDYPVSLHSSARGSSDPSSRFWGTGARCARAP